MLHRLSARGWPAKAIFLHVPLLPEQAARYDPALDSLPCAESARAVAIVAAQLRATGHPWVPA